MWGCTHHTHTHKGLRNRMCERTEHTTAGSGSAKGLWMHQACLLYKWAASWRESLSQEQTRDQAGPVVQICLWLQQGSNLLLQATGESWHRHAPHASYCELTPDVSANGWATSKCHKSPKHPLNKSVALLRAKISVKTEFWGLRHWKDKRLHFALST